MPRSEMPKWVDEYIDQIGSELRENRWDESDVSEIVHVSASGLLGIFVFKHMTFCQHVKLIWRVLMLGLWSKASSKILIIRHKGTNLVNSRKQ
ncbi:unnamed protein product [Camellia sinensis]